MPRSFRYGAHLLNCIGYCRGAQPLLAKKRYASSLRVLVVDGYADASREQFTQENMPFASTLYSDMLRRQAPRKQRNSIILDVIKPCAKDFLLPSVSTLASYDGVAFTGSSYSAFDESRDVQIQIELMRKALDSGVSTFGSCWGLQVAAVALGGVVEANPKGREVGVGRKISLTREGERSQFFSGKKGVFEAFESHGDEVVREPDGAVVLASNNHTRVQAMSVTVSSRESFFVQYHPEYDLLYYNQLISSRQDRMKKLGFFKDDEGALQYAEELAELANDNSRKDLKWKYGIDDDLLNPDIKEIEARNWLQYLTQ